MTVTKRFTGLALATAVALGGAATILPPPATAAPVLPAVAPDTKSAEAAGAAAKWIVEQKVSGPDAALALAAEGSQLEAAKALVTALATQAPTITSYGVAAKTALAAMAVGMNPTSFGGVDLLQLASKIDTGYPYPMSDALAAIALTKGKREVPAALVERLVSEASFNTLKDFKDPDSAGVLLSALSLVKDDRSAEAAQRLLTWLDSTMVDKNHWEANGGAVNSTALVAGAYAARGRDMSGALAFLLAQQAKTGSGAFPSSLDGTDSNAMATTQGLLFLAGVTYADAFTMPTTPAGPGTTPTTPPPTLNESVSCVKEGGVWTIVQVGAEVTKRGCVAAPATALDAVKSLATVETKTYDWGQMICRVDGTGQACDAAFTGTFWGLYTSGPNAPWAFAQVGADSLKPTAGSYLALVWGTEKALPKQVLTGDGAVPAAKKPGSTTTQPGLAKTGGR